MLKLKPEIDTPLEGWINSFRCAITLYDTDQVRTLLKDLPELHTKEEMERVLLLSMDAEIMICNMRQHFVNQKESIISKLPT